MTISSRSSLNHPQQKTLTNSSATCQVLHLIRARDESPFEIKNFHNCLCCNTDLVPDIIISTVDPPNGLKMIGKPELI